MIRLKSKNLRRLINEVIVRGRDFDICLFEALLIEDGGTIVKMAKRGARNNVVVDHTSDGEDYVIVARKNDAGDLEAKAAAIGSSEGGWWRLEYLYSNEPSTSVTPLAILSALARFKKSYQILMFRLRQKNLSNPTMKATLAQMEFQIPN